MRQRSPRFTRIDRTFAWLCTIIHSQATALGSALRSNRQIRKPVRRKFRAYRIVDGRLAETWISFLPAGTVWPDAAQPHWTIRKTLFSIR
jgi:hypothetical protein